MNIKSSSQPRVRVIPWNILLVLGLTSYRQLKKERKISEERNHGQMGVSS